MARYIDADTLRAKLCGWLDCVYQTTEGGQWDDGAGGAIAECVQELDDTPAADVATVVHARWEFKRCYAFENIYVCSNCGRVLRTAEPLTEYPYCHCGAKMDGGRTDG